MFAMVVAIYILCVLHVFSYRHVQLYVAFSSRVECELDNPKIGSVKPLGGSSGSYLQSKLFGCDPDS